MREFLGTVLAALLCCTSVLVVSGSGYIDVTVAQAKSMVDSDPFLVVLDVRTQSEYDSGHVRNAKLIPLAELEGRLNELNEADRILVYCMLGGRSSQASQILSDNGFLYVYNMLGGIASWMSNGYPVYVRYSSLQVAVNEAAEGDTLLVSSGTYYENVVVNKTVSLVGENRENTIVDGSGTGTVVTATNDKFSLAGFTIQNSGFPYRGIQLESASQCSISENSISNNWFNLDMYLCSNNSIYANSIGDGYYGIILRGFCSNNSISRNNITRTEWAMSFSNSSNNCAYENHVTANLWGVELQYSSNNGIYGNSFAANTAHGIWLHRSSDNSIYGNSMENNWNGIGLYESLNNSIYHNNFMNNTYHVLFLDSSFSNAWNNDCEGNYWSEYNGTDTDQDGVGNTPYLIDGNNTDYYPLMNRYWIPADVNHDLSVNIFDVVKITGAYGATPASPSWNPHADIAQPFEKIDIFDVVLCTGHYGQKWP